MNRGANHKQPALPFAEAEGTYDERRRQLAAALARVNCDLHLARFVLMVFDYTSGGDPAAAPYTRSNRQLSEAPFGLCCSVGKVRTTTAQAVEAGLVTPEARFHRSGEQAANGWRIDWAGVRALIGLPAQETARQDGTPPALPAHTPALAAHTPALPAHPSSDSLTDSLPPPPPETNQAAVAVAEKVFESESDSESDSEPARLPQPDAPAVELACLLGEMGLADARSAAATALANGWTPPQIQAASAWWHAHRGRLDLAAGALHWRLTHGTPAADPSTGWPPPGPKAVRERPPTPERSAETRRDILLRELRKRGIAADSDTERRILVANGFAAEASP